MAVKILKDMADGIKKWPWFAKTRVGKFLYEVLVEMVGVTWPSKDDVVGSTTIMVVTLVVVATFLYIVNILVAQALHGVGYFVSQIFS
jgi:preprotein translocase SecE subunit